MSQTTEQILQERQGTHGSFASNARIAQGLKEIIHNESGYASGLSHEQQEALDMICSKISRILSGNPDELDHWRDIAGYSTLVANGLSGDERKTS